MAFSIFDYAWLAFSIIVGLSLISYVYYILILYGLKIFKIENVTKKKVVVYLIYILVLGIIFYFITKFIDPVISRLVPVIFIYFVKYLFSFFFEILFIKYYFLITGKKFWQIFLYLTFVPLIFFGISTEIPLLVAKYNRFLGSISLILLLIFQIIFILRLRKKV